MEITFCDECYEVVAYTIKDSLMEIEIKGKNIKYDGKEAFCSICNKKVFVPDIRDYNQKQLDIALRKIDKLITLDEIKEILKKYNIGKRPLSLLLGWGEVTITRYIDGAIPTKEYSEKLLDILKNPYNMELIVDSNKDLISNVTYKKCKEGINKAKNLVFSELTLENKINSITQYLLIHMIEITPLALQKLLYYAQGFNKVFNGSFLFNDDCEAWAHGPVYSDVYNKYKNIGYNLVDLTVLYNEEKLDISNSEKEVLDTVIRNFGCYSGKVLESMTLSEYPWVVTRNGISEDIDSNEIIEKELILNYFEQVKQKYNMLSTKDVRDYSKDLFEKLYIKD